VGELIRYNLVFYRRGFHSVRTYTDDEEDWNSWNSWIQ
jgi:hypothetical protein